MSLLSLLKQTVTLAPYASQDAYGQVTWGAGVSTPCRIVQKNTKVLNPAGEEVLSTTRIYLDGSVSVTVRDKVTLPDATTPPILSIEDYPGASGTSFLKVVYT
jgi:hypothetical protein